MKAFALIGALLVAFATTACGDEEEGANPGFAGVSIEYALDHPGEEHLVNGTLLALGNDVRLCYALAESFPPQCGGPSLHVEGLELTSVPDLTTNDNVSWTDYVLQLRGVVEDETITVSENALE
jgi:hypothetical protein